MVTVRKPVSRRPAPAAAKAPTRPVRKAVEPAPAAKKAAPARQASEAKREQLAAARAAKSEKVAAAKAAPTEVHPVRKNEITAHDVLRAQHTYFTLYAEWIKQQGEEISEVLDFVAPIMPTTAGAPEKSPLTRAKVKPEERVIGEYYNLDDIENYSLKDLRMLAVDLAAKGIITETKLKTRILEQMEEAGLFREEGSAAADEDDIEGDGDEDDEEDGGEEAEEEDEDADSDDDEEVEYDRSALKKLSLKELQEIAEENEYKWKGLDKEELIDLLLASDEEEEEEGDEEEDEEVIPIDPDDLPNMDLDELLELAGQIEGLKIPASKKKNKSAVIKLILSELGEEDE